MPLRCVGCGSCAYVCPTAAIEVTRSGDTLQLDLRPRQVHLLRALHRPLPAKHVDHGVEMLPPLYSEQGELKVVLDMVKKKPARPAAHPPVQ
jgi:ferredoxin